MTVALVERKLFGGTCVNTGCMPTKTLVASAYAAHLARRGADYGVVLGGRRSGSTWRASRRAPTRCRANARTGVEKWLRGMPGCTVIHGPRPLRGGRHGPRRRRAADRAAHLHQRRRPRRRARHCPASTRCRTSPTPRCSRSTALPRAPGRRRRQLHRPRVRADVPALRRRGHGRREWRRA